MFILFSIFVSIAVGLGGYSIAIEPFLLRVNYYTFESKNVPKEFDGYKIAVIGDIHYANYLGERYLANIVETTNSINPDLIAGVGDYVKSRDRIQELRTAWKHLINFKAKDGVVMVNGNHDHWADHEESLRLLEQSGLSVRHRHKIISRKGQKIVIAGAGDFYEDTQGIDAALASAPETFRIVLAHNPDTADTSYESPVDLFLSGHTHGGQIAIPLWNYSPVIPVRNKNYDKGFKKNRKNQSIFITRGIGTSILPIRFSAPPEIAVIVLKRKDRASSMKPRTSR